MPLQEPEAGPWAGLAGEEERESPGLGAGPRAALTLTRAAGAPPFPQEPRGRCGRAALTPNLPPPSPAPASASRASLPATTAHVRAARAGVGAAAAGSGSLPRLLPWACPPVPAAGPRSEAGRARRGGGWSRAGTGRARGSPGAARTGGRHGQCAPGAPGPARGGRGAAVPGPGAGAAVCGEQRSGSSSGRCEALGGSGPAGRAAAPPARLGARSQERRVFALLGGTSRPRVHCNCHRKQSFGFDRLSSKGRSAFLLG